LTTNKEISDIPAESRGRRKVRLGRSFQKAHIPMFAMSRLVSILSACIVAAFVFISGAAVTPAAAAPDADAVKKATASCKADVKEQAKYHEMSWWARHKAVKKCVKDALAGH
jgi:hypothetical protein